MYVLVAKNNGSEGSCAKELQRLILKNKRKYKEKYVLYAQFVRVLTFIARV